MKFYVTFGNGTPKANHYAVVEAEDYDAARDAVFDAIGSKWAFMYTEDEFKDQPEKYGLTEIPL